MNPAHWILLAALMLATPANSNDWKGLAIPAAPPKGKTWELLPISDDFNYVAAPNNKPEEFTKRWMSRYMNPWQGPGLTEWNPGHSYVTNGHLGIASSRKKGTKKVYTGIITSKKTYKYPLFIEAKAKLSNQVLASDVWLLSPDSTQEIDVLEAYGSDRPGQEWYADRLHLSHHVFIRKPFQDYQPTDSGSWHLGDKPWRHEFLRIGVYWRDPWHLEYYVNGKLVRTSSGKAIIDPKNYTEGTGLNKAMHIIINMEDQSWRSDNGITPTDEELADTNKNIMWVDWIRVYQAVDSPSKSSEAGTSG